MPLQTSVTTAEPDAPADASGLYGWDWSATTHDGSSRAHVRDLLGSLVPATVLPGKGLQGWSSSLEAYDADGYKVGTVYYGGGRDDVHVVSTSAAADASRSSVLGLHDPRTARVDTRVDSLVPFDELAVILCEAADLYGSKVMYVESGWRPGEHETQGRTLYLGAPTSRIRVRLYEKWLESPGEYVEGTNRVEVQLRPVSSAVKARVSGWSRAETFCASRTTQALASRLGADLVPAASLHVERGTPDLEQTLAAMGKQYRRAVDRWLQVSGGDMDAVWRHLLNAPELQREESDDE